MSLTPQDIQSQQFTARFRGYDMDEVDEFLERVADEMLTLIQENKQLRERIEGLKHDLSAYREQERSFQKAIISAQQIADEMKEKSEAEAKRVVDEARTEAARLLQQAQDEVAAMERHLDELQARKNVIKEELRAMLTTHLSRLDEEEPAAPAPRAGAAQAESGTTPPTTADEVPNDDLYEKIDLPDTFLPAEPSPGDEMEGHEDEHPMSLTEITAGEGDDEDGAGAEEGDDQHLPDLEGEMLFSLDDDPLDDLAPDIKIKDEERDG